MLPQPGGRSVRRHRQVRPSRWGSGRTVSRRLSPLADGRSTLMPRATTWGSAKTSATLLIGPAGTPWASRAEKESVARHPDGFCRQQRHQIGSMAHAPDIAHEALVLRQLRHSAESPRTGRTARHCRPRRSRARRQPERPDRARYWGAHCPCGGASVPTRDNSWPDWPEHWSEHRAAPCRVERPRPVSSRRRKAARIPTTE